jgi:hypothetical protein
MPLFLKASDQKGKQGKPIFDPIGSNEHIKTALTAAPLNWTKIEIPEDQAFLGQDVDYGKNGTLVEAQFSNYPFLLNNVIRSQLFFQGKLKLGGLNVTDVVIITKARMFPASNSTLYFEQAKQQLTAMMKLKLFTVPVRLVGVFDAEDGAITATWTKYVNPRYSRTVLIRQAVTVNVSRRREGDRCTLTLADDSKRILERLLEMQAAQAASAPPKESPEKKKPAKKKKENKEE